MLRRGQRQTRLGNRDFTFTRFQLQQITGASDFLQKAGKIVPGLASERDRAVIHVATSACLAVHTSPTL